MKIRCYNLEIEWVLDLKSKRSREDEPLIFRGKYHQQLYQ